MKIRLGIDVACRAPHQASCADERGEMLWTGHRFRTDPDDLEALWAKLPAEVCKAKMRITPERPTGAEQLSVHPGREWFTVLCGTARLQLGERTILIQAGDAAEFSTMVPHAIGAHDGPVEILTIFDHDGERAHLHASDDALSP